MHTLPAAAVALGSFGILFAQSVPQTVAPAAAAALAPAAAAAAVTAVVVDRLDAETVWAGGPTWKARFTPAGTTFVPCFGAAAPRNFPAHLGRATVRVGEAALAAGPVAPTATAAAIEFAGAGFTERYVLGLAGIEQQFVLPVLPKRAAIAVEVPVASELAVQAVADGFRFTGEHGAFGYGRAVAIDAAGRRCELATTWTGSGFRIDVPAAFVAEAALPLLIDPLVGNVTAFASDTKAIASTDLAWHEPMGRYCLVWERVFSATDSDVFARYLDGGMQFASAAVTIDVSTDSWRAPRIAAVGSSERFLVVAQRSVGNAAPFTALGRFVQTATPFASAPLALFAPGADIQSLDVGGDPSTTSGRFCIVAAGDFGGGSQDIAAETRSETGALLQSVFVDASPALELAPQVSKSCGMPGGGTQGWGLAWLRRTGPSQNQPFFACVDRSLGLVAAPAPTPFQTPALANTVAVSSPTDHEQGRRYLLLSLYESGSTEFGRGALFSRTGALQVTTGDWHSSSDAIGEPQLDSDGTRFVLAFTQQGGGSPPRRQVNFVLLGYDATWVSWQQWTNGNTQQDTAPCVVGRRGGGGGDRDYGVAWVENLSPSGSRVVAANYDGIQEGAQFAVRYTSCGNLGFLSGGSTVLGESFSAQTVSSQGLIGWLVGWPVDLPVGICPGCRQGVDGAVVLGAAYTFQVPRNPAFVGLTVACQAFQFLPTAGAGACLSQINLSNTLDATLR